MRFAALLTLFVFSLSSMGSANAPASTSVSAEMRLLGAIRLWGDIRFFDPEVSEGQVDWDAAFMNAEPAVVAATTAAAYAAAIAQMLSALHDPATQVMAAAGDSVARITMARQGSASVITIEPGAFENYASFETNEKAAAAAASTSSEVLFDLRGASEANAAASAALQLFFADKGSPIDGLFSGTISLPRERSRSYLGYPDESGTAYQGYSAADSTGDATVLRGKSKRRIRLGFIVDGSTSLPPLAIALASRGDAAIYSTGGQPAVLSQEAQQIELPDGITVSYRTADLADAAERQSFASATVPDVPSAIAKLQAQPLSPQTYAPAPLETFVNSAYAGQLFPAEPMRMLAVARVYNVVRYFSPYRALMHDDWNAAALHAIADERVAADARAYVLGIMRLYAHLHDSHGFVYGPQIQSEFGAGPPFGARYLHHEVVVTRVFAGASKMQNIRIGDVIDTVDGEPIRQAMDRVERYLCSSTPQSADAAALTPIVRPSVFSGRAGTTLTLRFHHPDAPGSFTATFARAAYKVSPPPSSPTYFVLPGNVGYVAFDRLESSDVDAMFAALKNTRAIIFDNRGYPQGAAWPIAPRLTTATSVRLALFNTPLVIEPLDGPEGELLPEPSYRIFYQMMDTADGPRYLKPTVMLIDERANSANPNIARSFCAERDIRASWERLLRALTAM